MTGCWPRQSRRRIRIFPSLSASGAPLPRTTRPGRTPPPWEFPSRVAGTQLDMLSEEAAAALSGADVILAKGMANAETMLGCGYNVYYAFLVKCQRFVTRFGKPMFTPMLVKERE